MDRINPEILIWARETAGLSREDACSKIGLINTAKSSALDKLIAIETGGEAPSRATLELMSTAYRRALIVFYLQKPPAPSKRPLDFRSLPSNYPIKDKRLVDTLIRDMQVKQSFVKNGLEDLDEEKIRDFVSSIDINSGVEQVADVLRSLLNFEITSYRKSQSAEKAFDYLRTKVESIGVFVLLAGDLGNYYSSLDIDAFRGISLSDSVAPFIVINSQDAKPAWSFTLLHEMAHILLGHSSVSGQGSKVKEEQFCNDVASEILLPENDIAFLYAFTKADPEKYQALISNFASNYKVSHSLIAYKLYRNGLITFDFWQTLSNEYRVYWKQAQKKKHQAKTDKGPGYNLIRYKTGKSLLKLTRRLLEGGLISTSKAGRVLGVSGRGVQHVIYL